MTNSKIHVDLQVLGEIKEIYFSDSSFDSSDHELHVSIMLLSKLSWITFVINLRGTVQKN